MTLVDRAKRLLMEELNLSESQAYYKLRKEAMDRRRSIKDVARLTVLAYGKRKNKTSHSDTG